MKIIPTDSRISQSVAYRRTLKIPGKKIPTPLSFTFKAGLIRPQRILDILLLVFFRRCCCSHIHSAWRKGCVLGLNRLVSLGTSAWMPLFSMWMTHRCALLPLVKAARGTVERPFKSNCICIKYVSMKDHVTWGSCKLYSERWCSAAPGQQKILCERNIMM